MATTEQAVELLGRISQNKPSKFFLKLSDYEAGKRFVLIYLSEHKEDVYASTIAEKMHISRARMAVLIQKLVNKNLIEKKVSEVDGRIVVLKITPMGLAEINIMKNNLLCFVKKLIDKIGMNDINLFLEISSKINSVLNETE